MATCASRVPAGDSAVTAPGVSALAVSNIHKSFFGVRALRGVDLELWPGEVHALVGHNGSGKSTLCKILAGLYTKDEGSISVEGREVDIRDPHSARTLGISSIPQEPLLVPLLPAPANMFLGKEREFRRAGLIKHRDMKRAAEEALRRLDYECDLDAPVCSLSLASQEMIAIARALVWKAKVLILDEPTASLSRHEVDVLFRTMNRLRDAGVAQVFITHRLDEIPQIADRVTLLVDGLVKACGPAAELPPARLAELMMPQRAEAIGARPRTRTVDRGRGTVGIAPQADAEVVLAVTDLRWGSAETGVTFQVRRGEVVGITGQVGSGKTEIAHAIIGLERPCGGTVSLMGHERRLRGPADAVRAGIGFVPEDRAQSLVPLLSGADNILLGNLTRVSRVGFVRLQERARAVHELQKDLDIATPAQLFRAVRNLSGGNQQKVGLARWVFRGSSVLILDEPTRGIDVGTKARVHELVRALAAEGRAVLVCSSDFEEVVDLCDRVLVVRHGRVVRELAGDSLTEQEIVACAV